MMVCTEALFCCLHVCFYHKSDQQGIGNRMGMYDDMY